jgi:hypothetical protein
MATAGSAGASGWITVALTARVVPGDRWGTSDRPGELADVEEAEWTDWSQEGDNPCSQASMRVGAVTRGLAVHWDLLCLRMSFLLQASCYDQCRTCDHGDLRLRDCKANHSRTPEESHDLDRSLASRRTKVYIYTVCISLVYGASRY